MRKVRNIFLLSLLVIVLISNQTAGAKELSVFHSNANKIGYTPNRSISMHLHNSYSWNEFNNYVTYARNQWAAAGIQTYFIDAQNGSIEIHGGTQSVLEDIWPLLQYVSTPHTFNEEFPAGTHTYQGRTIQNVEIRKSRVFATNRWDYFWWTQNHYRAMFTHELGHALGWLGHSNVSADIMYNHSSSSIQQLTARDKAHLVQNY